MIRPSASLTMRASESLIPGRQMFLDDWPENEKIPLDHRMRLGRMLGATIDFILVGVDIKNRAAVASRKAAMLQRQAKFYATGRVKPGIEWLVAWSVLATTASLSKQLVLTRSSPHLHSPGNGSRT